MNKSAHTYRIGISGSFGGLNLGDEAILAAMVGQLRRTLPVQITVFSRGADDTLRRHAVDRAVGARRLARDEILPEVEGLDLLMLGGGGILFDADARGYLREPALALERGVPLMVYAIGAGPLNDPTVQQAVRETLDRASVITVREPHARRVLEEAGVTREILVTADPAVLLEPEPLPDEALEREGLRGVERLIGMSVREPGGAAPDLKEAVYHQLLADAADFMVDRYDAHVVFFPMERQVLDLQHAHAVVARMLRAERATVLKGEYSASQMLSFVGRLEFAVGMRLHFLIFAALQHVPFVALPYATKVTGFLEEMGIDTPPLNLVNAGRLLAYIDQSWDLRQTIRTQVEARLPQMQARARRTHDLAVELITRRSQHATRARRGRG